MAIGLLATRDRTLVTCTVGPSVERASLLEEENKRVPGSGMSTFRRPLYCLTKGDNATGMGKLRTLAGMVYLSVREKLRTIRRGRRTK